MAELTDYQAFELVLRPALRRSRRGKKADRKPGKFPTRKDYIDTGMRLGFQGNPEQLGEEYDRQLAAWRKKRHKKHKGKKG